MKTADQHAVGTDTDATVLTVQLVVVGVVLFTRCTRPARTANGHSGCWTG